MLRYRQNEPCCYSCIYLFIHYFFCVKHTGQSILFPGKPQGLWGRLSIQLWTQLSQISSYKLEHVAEKEENAAPCSTFPERERKKKNAFGQMPWEMQGGSLSSHPQIHAAAREGALSCVFKHVLPCHGFTDQQSRSGVQGQTWTAHSSLHSRMYPEIRHDPSLKGKQLFLLKWTK